MAVTRPNKFAHSPARSDADPRRNGERRRWPNATAGLPQLQDLNLVAPRVEKIDRLRGLTTRSACKAVLNFGTVLDGQRFRRL